MSYYRGDYYMAGGFFKKFLKKGTKLLQKASKLGQAVGPLVTAVNPALGQGITSISQTAGRMSQLLSPSAAPAGLAVEGSPPAGAVFQQATYGGMSEGYMALLVQLLTQQQQPRRRRRRR